MLPINEYITVRNRTVSNRTKIDYLVIHYVGAVSTALNNAKYFYSTYRGASAHYFVDDTSIWQVVLDKDIAWHCGANSYKHAYCRNSNSIGIEMCCFNNNGTIDVSETVVGHTLELAAYICKKYGITIDRVIRHYDVTGKNCPAPMVKDEARWNDFKNRLNVLLNGETQTIVPTEPEKPAEQNTMNKIMYVTAKTGLNVRTGIGTSYSIIRTLPTGAQVTVYEMSNGWARIGSGEWVSAAYLSETNPNAIQTKTMYVTASALNIRTGAGTNYRVLRSIPQGTKVTVYEEKNGWGRIGDGQWSSMKYLSTSAPAPKPTKTMYVTASALNVRSGAGTNHSVRRTISKGTAVTVYEESNGWSRIGNGEWVSSKYLTSQATKTKKVTASALNVRAGAGTKYKVVKVIYKNNVVTIYEERNGWSRIGNGQWVSSKYLA